MSVIPEFALGSSGDVHLVAPGLAISLAGNSLRLIELERFEQSLLLGASTGIDCYTINKTHGLIAYAEQGTEPGVHIYRVDELKWLNTIRNATRIAVSSLSFSADGKWLAVAGEQPSGNLVIWDWSAGQPVASVEMPSPVSSIDFHPHDTGMLYSIGEGGATMWRLMQRSLGAKIVHQAVPLGPLKPTAATWAADVDDTGRPIAALLVGCAGGEIVLFSAEPGPTYLTALLPGSAPPEPTDPEAVPRTPPLMTPPGDDAVLARVPDGTAVLALACEGSLVAVGGPSPSVLLYSIDLKRTRVEFFRALPLPTSRGLSSLDIAIEDDGSTRQLVLSGIDGTMHTTRVAPEGAQPPPPLSTVVDGHVGAVKALAPLPGGKRFASAGADGTLRVWRAQGGRQLGRRTFNTPLSALAAHPHEQCLAIGGTKGVVRLIDAGDLSSMTVRWRGRLHNSAIDALAWSPEGAILACLGADGHISFVGYDVAAGTASPIGRVKVPDRALNMVWPTPPRNSHDSWVVCSLSSSELMTVGVPPARLGSPSAEDSGLTVDAHGVLHGIPVRRMRLDMPMLSTAVPAARAGAGTIGTLFALAPDRSVRRYEMPADLAAWSGSKGRPPRFDGCLAVLAAPGGVALLETTAHGAEATMLAAAGACGTVAVVPAAGALRHDSEVQSLPLHSLPQGGAACATFCGGRLLTGGADGSIFCCAVLGASGNELTPTPSPIPPMGSSPTPAGLPDADVIDLDEEPLCIGTQDKKHLAGAATSDGARGLHTVPSMAAEAEAVPPEVQREHNLTRARVAALRERFANARMRNDQAAESERLTAEDLIVERELVAELRAAGKERVERVKEGLVATMMRDECVAERIKNLAYDSMATHAARITGMLNDVEVDSLPVVKERGLAKATRQVKFLRRVELHERMLRGEHPDTDAQLRVEFDEEGAPIPAPRLAGAARRPTGENGNLGRGGYNDSFTSSMNMTGRTMSLGRALSFATPSAPAESGLLYGETELFTPSRRVAQSILLQQQCEDIKQEYNKAWAERDSARGAALDRVADLTSRLGDIAREMQVFGTPLNLEDVPKVRNTDMAKPSDVLVVRDDEIAVERYVPPEEAERRARKAAEEEAHRREAAANNVYDRALKQMMGGKLTIASDLETELAMPPMPEWMQTAKPGEMSPDQLKQLKEYNAQMKALEEEKEKRSSALEAEAKAAKASIAEVCSTFDKSIVELLAKRQTALIAIVTAEVCAALNSAGASALTALLDVADARIVGQMTPLKDRKAAADAAFNDVRARLDARLDAVNALASEERARERAFRKEFHAAPGYARLLDAFRKPDAPIPHPTAFEMDEGPVWERFLAARFEKAQLEGALRVENAELAALRVEFAEVGAAAEAAHAALDALLSEATTLQEERREATWNMPIMLNMKLGLVEADPGWGLEHIHPDARLVDRRVVGAINGEVRHRGDKKVEVLRAIKDFRKGSIHLAWENSRLDMAAADLIAHTRELQLLHMTKSLQQILKSGKTADVQGATELAQLEARFSHNANIQEKAVQDRKQKLKRLAVQIKARRNQTAIVSTQCYSLAQQQDDQARVHAAMTTTEQPSSRRMRNVVTTKKLRDIAAAQRAEVAELQGALEKLHNRTYPSFRPAVFDPPDNQAVPY